MLLLTKMFCPRPLCALVKRVVCAVGVLVALTVMGNALLASETLKDPEFHMLPVHRMWANASLTPAVTVLEIVCSRVSAGCFAVVESRRDYIIRRMLISSAYLGTLTSAEFYVDDGRMQRNWRFLRPHVKALLAAPFLTGTLTVPCPQARVLVVGLGGGAVSGYLTHLPQGPLVTAIELDPGVVYLARHWFGAEDSDRLSVRTADAVDYVRAAAPDSVDVVILDASEPDAVLNAPIKAFQSPENVHAVARLLKPGGTVVVNVAAAPHLGFPEERRKLLRLYEAVFGENHCFYLSALLNYALVCSDHPPIHDQAQLRQVTARWPRSLRIQLGSEFKFEPFS